jgi:hypothetical protein
MIGNIQLLLLLFADAGSNEHSRCLHKHETFIVSPCSYKNLAANRHGTPGPALPHLVASTKWYFCADFAEQTPRPTANV